MVNFRRQLKAVGTERRNNQRIEFHYPVVILGVDEKARILDFSPGGFYIELGTDRTLDVGRTIHLALRLPIERRVLNIRAKVTYKDRTGIGCQLVDMAPDIYDSLERCFNIFNGTLPLD
ncbi:MAG: PilZ domain-containing protein [Desulfobacteraceae bacterium]|jgi:hypothetical protein